MRVSDDRYTRDRQRLDLGAAPDSPRARTFTIRQWTGLSDDRIRKLYRSYVLDRMRRVLRHRGKSPRQAAFFFRNPELNFQAAQLASLYVMYGLLCGTARTRVALSAWARSIRAPCSARPTRPTSSCTAPASISFEHAWFLLLALARRDEVGDGALRRVRRGSAARSPGEAPHPLARIASRRARRCRRRPRRHPASGCVESIQAAPQHRAVGERPCLAITAGIRPPPRRPHWGVGAVGVDADGSAESVAQLNGVPFQ